MRILRDYPISLSRYTALFFYDNIIRRSYTIVGDIAVKATINIGL